MRGFVLEAAKPNEPDFAERLEQLVQGIRATRGALIALMPSAPNDDAAWLAMMTRPDVVANLGELMLLSAKNAGWSNAIVQQVLTVLGQRLTDTTETVNGLVAGQIRAEMSCECGQCDVCQMRAKLGDEATRTRIEKMLRPQEKSPLVGPNGRVIH